MLCIKKKWDTVEAIKMYQSGKYTQQEIADVMGITRGTVGNYMRKHNIINPNTLRRQRPRKITINMVKQEFKGRGYELISTKYINCEERLKYICPIHKEKGVQKIIYSSFQQGSGCRYCGAESSANKNRLDYETVRQEFDNRGYELVTETYINAHQKLKYICPKHRDEGLLEINYHNLKLGSGCRYCKLLGKYDSIIAERNKAEFLNKDAIVYIIKCHNNSEVFYKIGITTNAVRNRFYGENKMPYNYTIIKEISTNLYDAVYLEEKLQQLHKAYSYLPKKEFGGYTECFSQLNIEHIEELAS